MKTAHATRKPEVLAPAGSAEALRAAIRAGADAVYFGLTDYNARIRARNFELGDLPDILSDLRRWGIKSYVVFNTLLFAEEMDGARHALAGIAEAGPTGLILQDLGVVGLARSIAPGLAIHASTQMTLASAEAVRLVRGLGVDRVILARELTIPEIARIRAATDMELEVFVHGALCVSYSGQCLSSEAWGGRSANRGQCAQACRLPYDLLVDGRHHPLEDRAYLLSPRDLEGYRHIPELMSLGIAAFKIEGRMKSADYVAASTALYRAAVDRAWHDFTGRPPSVPAGESGTGQPGSAKSPSPRPSPPVIERLATDARQVFSRGPSHGFLGGINHQTLVDGRTRSHRGLEVGTVERVLRDRAGRPCGIVVNAAPSSVELAAGDGLLIAVTALEEDEIGGRLHAVERVAGARFELRFARESMPDLGRVRPGQPVFRTSSPALAARLRESERSRTGGRRVMLSAKVSGRSGEPLRLLLVDAEGRSAESASERPLEAARHSELDHAQIRAHLTRLGDTRYALGDVDIDVDHGLFLPVSELNHMRRAAVEEMERVRGRRAAPLSRDAGVSRADVPHAEALRAEVPRADGPGTDVPGADVPGAGGPSADVPGADVPGAGVPGADVPGADVPGADVPGTADTGAESPVAWAVDLAESTRQSSGATALGERDDLPKPTSVLPDAGEEPPRRTGNDGSFEDQVIVLCRDLHQVKAALRANIRRVTLDFLDLVGLKEASAVLRSAGVRRSLALPRVQKPGEERICNFFLSLEPEEILIRNLGGLQRLRELLEAPAVAAGLGSPRPLLTGDVSLNAVNPPSFNVLLQLGLSRVAPGLDLNGGQLLDLLGTEGAPALQGQVPADRVARAPFAAEEPTGRGTGPLWEVSGSGRIDPRLCEIPLHHHLPVFHTEHCVFAAFLSEGADYRTCGRPCDTREVKLRDRVGAEHPVKADAGCRNTVFNARAQTGAEYVARLQALGARHFRLEFLDESPAQASRAIALYRQLLRGEISAAQISRELKLLNQLGVTRSPPRL